MVDGQAGRDSKGWRGMQGGTHLEAGELDGTNEDGVGGLQL